MDNLQDKLCAMMSAPGNEAGLSVLLAYGQEKRDEWLKALFRYSDFITIAAPHAWKRAKFLFEKQVYVGPATVEVFRLIKIEGNVVFVKFFVNTRYFRNQPLDFMTGYEVSFDFVGDLKQMKDVLDIKGDVLRKKARDEEEEKVRREISKLAIHKNIYQQNIFNTYKGLFEHLERAFFEDVVQVYVQPEGHPKQFGLVTQIGCTKEEFWEQMVKDAKT